MDISLSIQGMNIVFVSCIHLLTRFPLWKYTQHFLKILDYMLDAAFSLQIANHIWRNVCYLHMSFRFSLQKTNDFSREPGPHLWYPWVHWCRVTMLLVPNSFFCISHSFFCISHSFFCISHPSVFSPFCFITDNMFLVYFLKTLLHRKQIILNKIGLNKKTCANVYKNFWICNWKNFKNSKIIFSWFLFIIKLCSNNAIFTCTCHNNILKTFVYCDNALFKVTNWRMIYW